MNLRSFASREEQVGHGAVQLRQSVSEHISMGSNNCLEFNNFIDRYSKRLRESLLSLSMTTGENPTTFLPPPSEKSVDEDTQTILGMIHKYACEIDSELPPVAFVLRRRLADFHFHQPVLQD